MGVMDKFLNYMKLNDEEEDSEYYDSEYLDDEPEPAAQPKRSNVKKFTPETTSEPAPAPKKAAPKTVPMRSSIAHNKSLNGMEVCVIKPTSMDDAREVTETLLGNRTVVLNLEGLDYPLAQRIIDFTAGSCFAIAGNLQKIARGIFIITPASVEISGDIQDIFGDNMDTLE